jgi:uncharacterized membrane protein YjgN (DUF898 family)
MQASAIASVPSVPATALETVAEPRQGEGMRVAASGSGLSALVWRGLFLTIVTLGIYRFWYRTDLRRWYWRSTAVAGDGFEYRGTPGELFIGFLIALAVTLPLYFAGALAALFIASEATTSLITLGGIILLVVLAQYGAYRARRFRMTRTVWRGVRLDQGGSAWRYARVSILWGLATLFSLGLTLPLFRRSIEGMKIANTRFGTASGRFSVPVGGLMLRWVPVWLVIVLTIIGAVALFIAAAAEPDGTPDQRAAAGFGFLLMLAGLAISCAAWPFYRAAEFRLFTNGSGLGPLSFVSDLKGRSLLGMYLIFGLVLAGLGMLALVLAAFVIGGFAALFTLSDGRIGYGMMIVAAVCYLGGLYLFMGLKELLLNRAFWRRATGSITVFGLDQIHDVMGAPVDGDNAAGEGLGDALDFGGV